MRQISATLDAILAKNTVRAFSLIKLDFPLGSIYATDYGRDLWYNGNLYLASAGLIELEPPKLSSTVDRENYKISFDDQNDVFQALFRVGAVGVPVEVVIGFEGLTGEPELDPADTLLAYRGRIDDASIENDFEKKIAIIGLSSPLANLDDASPFWTTAAGMDQFSSTDTAFDNALTNNEEINVKWGKV